MSMSFVQWRSLGPHQAHGRCLATSQPGIATNAFGEAVEGRWSCSATLLADGRVLIAGGSDSSNVLASAELYDPKSRNFSSAGSMTTTRANQTATRLVDGRVLVAGGRLGLQSDNTDSSYVIASAELFQWTGP